jgi:hypothetical protein
VGKRLDKSLWKRNNKYYYNKPYLFERSRYGASIQNRAERRKETNLASNHRLGYLTMLLSLVVVPTQAKSSFHPLGEKTESRGYRNKQYPQEF